jgi:hypothetical protein
LNYFVLTTEALIQLQRFTDGYRDRTFQSALDRAHRFALNQIAPMTDPNQGPPTERRTPGTPAHITTADNPKKAFALGMVLIAGKNHAEGAKIIDHATQYFTYGHAGQDGAHAVEPCAMILRLLQPQADSAK